MTVCSSAPRTRVIVSSLPGATSARAANRSSGVARSASPARTRRSPSAMPAAAPGESSTTLRTSSPSRSGNPTERRSLAARCGGARATPSRARSIAAALDHRRNTVAQVGISGAGEIEAVVDAVGVDPDDLAGAVDHGRARRSRRRRGGVLECSDDARPRGPRNPRSALVTCPQVARTCWRPAVTATTTSPAAAGSSAHCRAGVSPVSTSMTTRSPSTSLPRTVAWAVRPSAKRTDVVRSRRLWALVTTRPWATTKPLPRPWWPIDTTDGPTSVVALRTRSVSSWSAFMVADPPSTCELQVTLDCSSAH